MEQSAASSSSKVKIEYHDPHNVFPCISGDLESKLPLRSLNWNSPGRPLRLIDTLFIEFEPVHGERGPQAEATSDAPRRRSRSQSFRNRDSDGTGTRKERRHQFPGLRQTPYLKVLLIRCDDTDTYKSTSRKEIREWIKAHTPPSQKSSKSSNQENHDAFEWMILHVVFPDADRKVTWPHRNSTKILGYLRDDFNSSSKNAVDRVAQVPSTRISATDENRATIPDATFQKQAGDAWDASLSTLKQLILFSFDQRVRQYEDDIKEKRAQRSLPGWNFCTFFVLKEGLSRGFESVGLVEDALSGYDELHAELDSTIRSKHSDDGASQDATIFRDVTPEIAGLLKEGVSTAHSRVPSVFDKQVVDANKKPYRDLILSSDISVFDFKTYIFAREVTLLQRLGNADKTSTGGKKTTEPRFLCDICQRATSFIASAGTILRDDVLAAAAESGATKKESTASIHALTQMIVSTWTYAVAFNILEIMDKQGVSSTTRPTSQPSVPGSATQGQAAAASNAHYKSLLSSRRAALTVTARRALQQLGLTMGWKSGWAAAAERLEAIDHGKEAKESDVPVDESKDGISKGTVPGPSKKNLKKALASLASFHATFASLTQSALQRHQEAGDLRSSRSMQVDLAVMKFVSQEYTECATTLEQILEKRLDYAWMGSQNALLTILSECYRQSHNTEAFVHASLRLVTCLARAELNNYDSVLQKSQDSSCILSRAIDASKQLDEVVLADLQNFVDGVKFDSYVEHADDGMGFTLRLWLNSSVLIGTTLDKLTAKLVRADQDDASGLLVFLDKPFTIGKGFSEIFLSSSTITPGLFTIKSLIIDVGKIRLVHDFNDAAKQSTTVSRTTTRLGKNLPKLRLWTHAFSPNITLDIFEEVNLDRPKSLVLVIQPGKKPLEAAQIQLKAASAGLRLHTAQAKVIQGQCTIRDVSKPGLIDLKGLESLGTIRLIVPFQMDYELKVITVRCELLLGPVQRQQRLSKSKTLPVLLPLGVNVQDVFKEKMLFSKFSISSSTGIPLRVTDYDLTETPGYKATYPPKASQGLPVFGRQPASLTYKIEHKAGEKPSAESPGRLRLVITYQCLDEEILLAMKSLLHEALDSASFGQYKHLLEDHIENVMRAKFTTHELESVALLREANVPPYDQMQWNEALSALPSDGRKSLESWLRSWHHDHQIVSLSATHDQISAPFRKIDIPVDVPPMQVVHTASLRIINLESTPFWRVGDAIPAELKIRLTTHWSRPEATKASDEAPLTFNYELDAPPDSWIIGGQRRALFSMPQGQELKFPVMLLPQRAGHLLLPSLDVRVINTETNTGAPHPQVHCEVDYRNQGEAVLVIPAVEVPTVGVNVRGERRSWLIDAN